jgi:hypothetical protein
MADSIDCANFSPRNIIIPGGGNQPIALTAGYANGTFHDSSQSCGATDVQIDVNGSLPGVDVLDIETGDATPAQAPAWVHAHNAHGGTTFPAVLYCNRSTMTAVANACQAQNLLPGRDFYWWVSTLDGTVSLSDMTGVVAVQAWGSGFFSNRNIDLSVVYNDAFKPTVIGAEPVLSNIELPGGINQHVAFGCAGARNLRFHLGFGDQIVIHQIIPVGDTPGASGAAFLPGFDEANSGGPWTWVADRDGPWAIPAGATDITLRYDFTPDTNSAGARASVSDH